MIVLKIIGFLALSGVFGVILQLICSLLGLSQTEAGSAICVIVSDIIGIILSLKFFFGKKKDL